MWQRWNSGTKIFEKSDNNGGSWTPLGLDAAIITQGVFDVARIPVLGKANQHAQTAYLDANNVFTKFQDINPATIGESFHRYRLAGNTYGIVGADGALKGTGSTDLGIFAETGKSIRFMTNGSATDKFVIDTAGKLYERGRVTAIGEWTNFTPVWTNLTVGNGNLVFARFTKIGKTVHFELVLFFGTTTAVTGPLGVDFPTTIWGAASAIQGYCRWRALDHSTSIRYTGIDMITTGSTTMLYGHTPAPVFAVTATTPFTWAVSDQLHIAGTYEEA